MSQGARFARHVMLAWVLWAVSLLLPSAGVRADGDLIRGDFMYSGWQVAEMCVISPAEIVRGDARHLIRAMGLTNLITLASPLTLLNKRPAFRRVFMFAAVGAFVLNLNALVLCGRFLSYGYLVWQASFAVLAVGTRHDASPPRPF
jgi:hypothetical protein